VNLEWSVWVWSVWRRRRIEARRRGSLVCQFARPPHRLRQADPATCPFLSRWLPITRLSLFSHNILPSLFPSPNPFLAPLYLPSMPTCRRKRVVLTEPSNSLLHVAASDPTRQVYYLEQTGEIFESYEYEKGPLHLLSLKHPPFHRAYAARMSFYRLKQFQCEVTGKSGLDYFQALDSERQEARTLHSRFSEPLKPAVLKAVQWRMFLSSNASSCV
jgi:hypothetical protein